MDQVSPQQSNPPVESQPPVIETPPKSKLPLFVILGIILLLLVGGGAYYLGKQSQQPAPVTYMQPSVAPTAYVTQPAQLSPTPTNTNQQNYGDCIQLTLYFYEKAMKQSESKYCGSASPENKAVLDTVFTEAQKSFKKIDGVSLITSDGTFATGIVHHDSPGPINQVQQRWLGVKKNGTWIVKFIEKQNICNYLQDNGFYWDLKYFYLCE
ncbi:hypothetical protein HYT33_03400 [Candidatus Roizmanbacteria bacterium]|nr:hypothetical protein [Candidatus Roizmanbacteria bacterium]